MPRSPKSLQEKPKREFHRIVDGILKNSNPAEASALAYWRQKHQDAIKELRGEGKRFKSQERFESYATINKELEPLYEAVKQRDFDKIRRQRDEIDAWAERMIKKSQSVSPGARQFIMVCTIVNLYYLAIAKTMIALLLSSKRRHEL